MPTTEVPLLVQVVSGNPVTSAGVLLCLDTYDATALRRAHPVLARTVADVPWCDTAAAINDVCRWRAALPAAVGGRVSPKLLSLDDPALLARLMSLHAQGCDAVTDAVVQHLPPALRHLTVQHCRNLAAVASFTHLPALTSLDCSATKALDEGLGRLPPSLQELRMDSSMVGAPWMPAASFCHLHALRVLSWRKGYMSNAGVATLPPTLEVLDIAYRCSWYVDGTMSLAHLPRLRILRSRSSLIIDAMVAALPVCLEELDVAECYSLTPAVSLSRLRALRTLCASDTRIVATSLTSLPPSLVLLDVSRCKLLSPAATLPDLPALQELDASSTSVGNALVASLPPCLHTLHLTNCPNVTPAADVRHLAALRELQCSGTDLPPTAVAALRARGCFAPADPVLRAPSADVESLAALADGRLVTGYRDGELQILDPACGGAVVASGIRHAIAVVNPAVLPDGRRVAVATSFGPIQRIEVWDTHTTPPTRRMSVASESGVRALVVLSDGRLAFGCASGRIRLVDTGTVCDAPTPMSHTAAVTALVVFRDGTLASGSDDATVRVWNVGSATCMAVLTGHSDRIAALAVLASGHLASASNDRTVRLWDAATWTCYAVLSTNYRCVMVALPDGRLACSDPTSAIHVWDTHRCLPSCDGNAATGQRSVAGHCVSKVELKGHTDSVTTMALLPDGRLVSGGADGVIHMWCLPPPRADDAYR